MEYQKTNIVAFAGLENNRRAELIEDQQASDIENLRFDKLGYLVNRNGVKVRRVYDTRVVFSDLQGDIWPIGTVGFGEYVLEHPFGITSPYDGVAPYDDASMSLVTDASQADKFLVAAIRLPTNYHPYYTDSYNSADTGITAIPDALNWRYKMAYVLIPQTGSGEWAQTFAFAPNGSPFIGGDPDNSVSALYATVGSRVISKPDDSIASVQTYAPARRLGDHNSMSEVADGVPGAKWIDNYVQMRQYRKSVTIADRTNGDLQLVDEIHEADYDQPKLHRFSLRQNAVAEFDVDDVVVNFGVGEGGFNEGVKAPMVLYKYYLSRRRGVATQDNYKPYYTQATQKSPSLEIGYLRTKAQLPLGPLTPTAQDIFNAWSMPPAAHAFLYAEVWYGEGDGLEEDDYKMSGLSINSVREFTFTMNENGEEVDDLFSTLTLQNPDAPDDALVAADPYIWEDLELEYYPVSGKTYGKYLLTALDREWDQTNSGTKIVELKTKTGVEQEVPLGIWRYRFVWDLGNGEYSAASSELVVPDLLFSGTKDLDVIESLGTYQRPFGMSSEADAQKTSFEVYPYSPSNPANLIPYFFNDDANVAQTNIIAKSDDQIIYGIRTAYARNFTKVKEAIYYPDHMFGAKESSTGGASWPTDWVAEDVFSNGQFHVIATVFFPDDVATLSGVFAETAITEANGAEDVENVRTDVEDYNDIKFSYKSQAVQLQVPLFGANSLDSYMYNSVFTDTGVIRTIYQNKQSNAAIRGYDPAVPCYQIVFPGRSRFGFGLDDPESLNIGCDVVENSDSIYFNLVPVQRYTGIASGGGPVELDMDLNNDLGSTVYDDTYSAEERKVLRNHTIVRGVRNENHRLLNVRDGIKPQVLDRLLLQGTGEFTLCEHGDLGSWVPQFSYIDSLANIDFLKRDTKRAVIDIAVQAYPGGVTYPYSPWWSADGQAGYAFTHTKVFGGPQTFTATKTTTDFSNLKVVISGRGERLTIPEQLTAYFPASILFEAPHVELNLPADRIPRRARRLLVFRTRASHDNAWQPHEYGLSKAIDIIRDANGDLTGEHANGISYLDDVKSSDLDFSYDLNTYEAFTVPLKSRFCLPLNERVYYGNFIETYRPRRPRLPVRYLKEFDDDEGTDHRNTGVPPGDYGDRLWSWRVVEADTASVNTLPTAEWLYYFLGYEDSIGAVSLQSFSGPIDRTTLSDGNPVSSPDKGRVAMYCLPSQYDPIVEKARIYRLATETPIPVVRPYPADSALLTNGHIYYVAQGVVEYNGSVYYPTDVIRASDTTDSGVGPAAVGTALDSFKGPGTYNGIHGTHGDFILYDITDHLDSSATGPYIEKIDTIEPEAEGVFYDDDKSSLGRLSLRDLFPNLDNLESGIRWSEPYTPNKIKLGSLIEVRAGDGDQITGMEALYGNIVVLKERSIHRIAVQAQGVPVSRVDEISNTVGCIAPNTVLCINNELFFLSWSGFYRYNNNVLQKMDIPFSEELQLRLRNGMNGEPDPAIRDASCGWNPTYREIYLNIPIMSSVRAGAAHADEYDGYVTLTDSMGTRQVRGTVYALNIDTGLATKYRYMDDSQWYGDTANALTPQADAATQRSVRTQARLYHTTSLGKMMSAEVFPARTINYITILNPQEKDKSRFYLDSTFYMESPTKQDFNQFDKEDDEFLYYRASPSGFAGTTKPVGRRYVRTFWRSKTWTAEDKSVLKRFRKAFAYFAAASQPVIMRGITHTSPEGATEQTFTTWAYQYDSGGQPVTGELLAVPAEAHSSNILGPAINRGERYTFELESGGRTQIEYFGFYWKPINTYER